MSGRIRKLTSKAMANYVEKVKKLEKNFEEKSAAIEKLLQVDIYLCDIDNLEKDLSDKLDAFHNESEIFKEYLETIKTDESLKRLSELTADRDKLVHDVTKFKDKVTQWNQIKRNSLFSPARSVVSQHSTTSSAKARVAAAKAKLRYAEMEAKLRKEKAELEEKHAIESAAVKRQQETLDIDIDLVKQQCAFAEIEAEVDENDSNDCKSVDSIKIPTSKFITTQTQVKSEIRQNMPQKVGTQVTGGINQEVTKFLLRKDLTMSRLTHYNDKPEDYESWKNSFISVCQEMDVSPNEELDLLVKWLGPISQKHALNIRSAHSHDPITGLERTWDRLNERYGTVDIVHKSILQKLDRFPKILAKDSEKLYELSDILWEIQALKQNPSYALALSYFDTSVGVNPIVSKLPHFLQEKWIYEASRHKQFHDQIYPTFDVFVNFLHLQAKIRNDPSLISPLNDLQKTSSPDIKSRSKNAVWNRKTDVDSNTDTKLGISRVNNQGDTTCTFCPIHKSTSHNLENCRTFLAKQYNDRRQYIINEKLCFKCFKANHLSKNCREYISCSKCKKRHNTLMHKDFEAGELQNHGGEADSNNNIKVSTSCMEVCGNENFSGRSCAKVCLVRVSSKESKRSMLAYAIIDDQSNRSLAKSVVFERLKLPATEIEYTINSCTGQKVKYGKVADCVIQSHCGQQTFELKNLLECEDIPDLRHEIPTPEVAQNHPHLAHIANYIPTLNAADICILIGRDLIEAHHVLDQKFGPKGSPYAQKLPLGWVIVGEVCVGTHKPNIVTVNKLFLLSNGRESNFEPCPNIKFVKECTDDQIFRRYSDDEELAYSVIDKQFIDIMDNNVKKVDNKWSAPLPFHQQRARLPNNFDYALHRAKLFAANLSRNPTKQIQVFDFMGKLIDDGHAEIAPKLDLDKERWYLPVFGVYHPHKPDQVRCVFDSSAVYKDVSLNKVLLPGPDLTNNLLGILLRFRKMPVAIMADIKQMFYCFSVHEEHRDYLRFFWHEGNNPDKPLIEYRMTVHVFGNSPSPAIATYCLRKSVETADAEIQNFVYKDFYVDDALISRQNENEAVSLIKRTQEVMSESNIVLHKIASNSPKVVSEFDSDELSKDLKDINLKHEALPVQRSLGLLWNMSEDRFVFDVVADNKPFTRRGVLSIVNSIFDPIGFLAPVSVKGKIILRKLKSETSDWDEQLPMTRIGEWNAWKDSLVHLNKIYIPRCYSKTSLKEASQVNLLTFCDASELAIAAVAYMVVHFQNWTRTSCFILGKAKVAPSSGHTMPRLELCAAVLAVQVARTVQVNIDIPIDCFRYYTDSKIVLGYIHNSTRRFTRYVSNRVEVIKRDSSPEQWRYVSTQMNPADVGTRGIQADKLQESKWLNGPPDSIMFSDVEQQTIDFELIKPDEDKEVKKEVNVNLSVVKSFKHLGSQRFTRFSSWKRLVTAIALLKKKICMTNEHNLKDVIDKQEEAKRLILRECQIDAYAEEHQCLAEGKPLPKRSSILKLNPYIDEHGLLRVGGRLKNCNIIQSLEKNPVIIPRKHHIATLLTRHFHESVFHQGRHFTEGAIRAAGFWIIGSKRLVSSLIHDCVFCRRYRGKFERQQMADLPSDRIEQSPPFTYVGVDMFGPFYVVTRKTRSTKVNIKRWAILFTCLCIRAVHIEVVEDMSASSFLNALRRFISIRGKVKQFRSDRGTNFVGATEDAGINAVNVEDQVLKSFLLNSGTTWLFNSPHSSHMGGAWERMIGTVRRILDNMLVKIDNLTHEMLVTFMAEVSAVVNSRPLIPVSYDSEIPEILTPNTLLTQKMSADIQETRVLNTKDLYKAQWLRVRHLADTFWKRWKRDYLHTLQIRQKWNTKSENIAVGDIVVMRDQVTGRMDWPIGRVLETYTSDDGLVRKVKIRVHREGKLSDYIRPIVEVVLLMKCN
ncbi:uncharacterized protein LOC132731684 [Ruditapes philippinarum]|uniref:uncharacterized protein LOC132731684 n=1 Tax=Ruditapes philippinarum TaxID=129788 RepID=UPI00295B1052|nr:uncharacterized protein LOC132731684 [Ruditapes philippinarum]